MPKKPLSKRGAERRALQSLYSTATYSGLTNLLDIGKLNLKELRKYYTDARAKAVKRVARIEKSNIPFTDRAPEFLKTSELTDDELLKAVSQVNKFLHGPTTISERRAVYSELLEDLHNKGLTFLKMSNLKEWDRFRQWIKAKGAINLPYVDGSVLADIFKTAAAEGQNNSQRWNELFEEFKKISGRRKRGPRRRRL